MLSALGGGAIAGLFALIGIILTNRQKDKGAKRKETSDLVKANTADRRAQEDRDDVAADRALKINEAVIAGLSGRIDLLVDQQYHSDWIIDQLRHEVSILRRAMYDAGVTIPTIPALAMPARPQAPVTS